VGGPYISCIAVLAAFAFLACPKLSRPVEAHVVNPCEGMAEWALFVDSKRGPEIEMVPADDFVESLRDDEAIRDFIQSEPPDGLGITLGALREVFPPLPPQDLEDLIPALTALLRRIDNQPESLEQNLPIALQGIGGLSTTLLLTKLLGIADKVVYGKIRDYIFLENPGKVGSGHISVDVCIDRREFVPLGQDWRQFFHWDVEIPPDIFKYVERTPPRDPFDPNTYNDPFPGFSLPKEAVDPANPRSTWRRGLDHKLHAENPSPEGPSILVRHIYYRGVGTPDLIRLPDAPPDKRDSRYNSTKESCIDLFTAGPPPATFGELVENAYCLGRCEQPAIFNTGGSGAWERPD